MTDKLALLHSPRPEPPDGGLAFDLPWPPSTNTYWRHTLIKGKPRVLLSQEGRVFRRAAAHALLLQGIVIKGLDGRLAVQIILHAPDRTKRDLDNFGGKAVLDAITHANVWHDDSQVDDLHIRRGHIVKGGLCHVRIRTLNHDEIVK